MFIGIMGAKGCGKDTVADLLVEKGYYHGSFADPVRAITEAINPIVGYTAEGEMIWDQIVCVGTPIHYNTAIKKWGYTKTKEKFPEARRFLQKLGTEGGRNLIHPDIWVDLLREEVLMAGYKKVVLSDCRFQNEVDFVRENNGKVVTIIRTNHDSTDDHVSEKFWKEIPPDDVLYNDGTLEDLKDSLEDLLKDWLD